MGNLIPILVLICYLNLGNELLGLRVVLESICKKHSSRLYQIKTQHLRLKTTKRRNIKKPYNEILILKSHDMFQNSNPTKVLVRYSLSFPQAH